jgi:peptidoglycan/xylan/chitin deacetylase (PgdA/CDA1 family)
MIKKKRSFIMPKICSFTSGTPILMYHEVTNNSNFIKMSKMIQYSYILDSIVFKQQMEYLNKNGFRTLRLNELRRLIELGQSDTECHQSKYIVLSFDDGFIGNYENVFPILADNGLVGNFFLITGHIGKHGMMSWEQIREMRKCGMYFGSHTVNHLLLGSLSRKEIFFELGFSKARLEGELGQKVEYLSLPHGSYNQEYIPVATDIGYLGGCCSDPGLNRASADPFFLKRMPVPRNASFSYFADLCERRKHVYYTVFIKKKSIRLMKKVVGESRYLALYNRFFGVEES